MTDKNLPKEYYLESDVVKLAKDLIGKVIHTNIEGEVTSALITETEAYAGVTDRASHAFGGRRTQRTETMYKEGGIAYVYFCYGMHYLFNIVTNVKDFPHAILIRGIFPLNGSTTMLKRVNKNKIDKNLGNGPGKVTKLLGIIKTHNSISLMGDTVWLSTGNFNFDDSLIIADKRIGIDYAGDDALLPYRFYLKFNDVSKIIEEQKVFLFY